MSDLTHFNASGEAHMVDVGTKQPTHRVAIAQGRIKMQRATLDRIIAGEHKKGDVLGIARIAGIMAAKKTADLIPLCHPLPLSHIQIDMTCEPDSDCVVVVARAETTARTGVEMEALTAVHISLLTIYDMCKSVDRGMVMEHIRLLEKAGGKSGHWTSSTPEDAG